MFKTKTRERRIFSHRQQKRRRFSLFSAIASLALFLLILELLTRIFVDLSGNRAKFAQGKTGSEVIQSYQLKFVPNESQVDRTNDQQALLAKPALSVGYQLVGNQESQFWQINPQGFRDRDAVPLVKPKDEIRIFILGGSTAFGYGSRENGATISEQLEQRLEERLQQQKTSPQLYKSDLPLVDKPKKQKSPAKPVKIKPGNYRVINAAVPGYASGNELAQLALQVLKYKPDLIIVMDGYEDFMLPSNEDATQVPELKNYLEDRQTGFKGYINQLIEPIKNKSYLAKIAQERWLNSKQADEKADFILDEQTSKLVQHLPQNQKELQARIDRYVEHQKQMLNLSTASLVPLIVAMQPEITGRNPAQLTDTEGTITTELGRTYIERMRDEYPALIEATQQLAQAFPQNLKAVDLYNLSEQYPSPSFIDPIHLNEAANQKVAEQLYYAISSFSKMQVIPKQAPTPKPVDQNR